MLDGTFYHVAAHLILQTVEPDGRKINHTLCSHPGNDVSGMFARVEKIAGSCEKVHASNMINMANSSQLTPLGTLCKQEGPFNWNPMLLSLASPLRIVAFFFEKSNLNGSYV